MSTPTCHNIFVYGSLRSGFNSPAYNYISQYFDLVSPGRIRGTLYDLGAYPAALPTAEDRFIIGELYTIRHADEFEWAMAQLDDYEGIDASYDEPSEYRRDLTEVWIDNGQTATAWVYWYTADVTDKPVVASGDVLQYLQEKMKSL
ncbi:MAG: gamma-glutamylcyclotransferase [Chitinophagaceae bacterium]|jgi:gamma-glutamylcyclotransferase (GGCT)/AIG2-like uncharacterized protein YtfP|nr:gamma-glutamylcyclotransferase [Chitinophagaceae bacterium]